MRTRLLQHIVIVSVMLWAAVVDAAPSFIESRVQSQSEQFFSCDLDGDGLKDLVFLEGTRLDFFYQDAQTGFPLQPQQQYDFGAVPALVWPARLGKEAESILAMTWEGVCQLAFRGRTQLPDCEKIIARQTVVPKSMTTASVIHFPLSAGTASSWPLLLVPAGDDLEVWRHEQTWSHALTLRHALRPQIRRLRSEVGYGEWLPLNLGLNDLNGDGREDLVLRSDRPGKHSFAIYLQNTNALFAPEPVLIYETPLDWRSWHCWLDLNKDGHIDLIKNSELSEPWFLPGFRSGKVLVGLYLADAQDRIPAEPQQIFRKNDWIPSIPIVDIDGDGLLDLALGYSAFDSREGLRKGLTAKQLDFNVRFHFSRPQGPFPLQPDAQRDILIHLDKHSLLWSFSHRVYFERFVSLEGDFNGDGRRDLLVRDHSDSFSVYYFLSREKGFSAKPDVRLPLEEPITWFRVAELNGDGCSDLILKLSQGNDFKMLVSHSPRRR